MNPVTSAVAVADHVNVVPATFDTGFTAVVLLPEQIACGVILVTVGVGLTVIVNVFGVPEQVISGVVFIGVTVIVAVIGLVVEFVAVKEILPVPLAARPIDVLLFVQLKPVALVPVKFTVAADVLHTGKLLG